MGWGVFFVGITLVQCLGVAGITHDTKTAAAATEAMHGTNRVTWATNNRRNSRSSRNTNGEQEGQNRYEYAPNKYKHPTTMNEKKLQSLHVIACD